jgi:amino acid adenylation domain-containing protein
LDDSSVIMVRGPDRPDVPSFLETVRWNAVTLAGLPAVRDVTSELTYGQLWGLACRYASSLRESGLCVGETVPVLVKRSPTLVAALVGVLQAGGTYLPLDPAYPLERLRFMAADSGARIGIGGSADLSSVVWIDPIDAAATSSVHTTCPSRHPPYDGERGCYVIYTSGSTGRPKGVRMPHRSLDNVVAWQVEDSLCKDLTTAQFAPISFDVSFQEIFTTLAGGGTCVIVPEDARRDPALLWEVIITERIERLFLPFVALQMLAAGATHADLSDCWLREVITAGEQLICSAQLRDLFRQLPGCRLVNQYGPTETHALTQYSLPWSPDEWPEFPPIGSPLPNCTILVASGTAKEDGELLAAGRPVGLGYHNRPELTAERFVDVQLGRHLARAYRTGDNVRVGPDGLEFLGRLDDQVKIRGYRVELGEVDAALLRADGVAEACACVVRSPSGHNRLEAVVVADREFSQHALDRCIGELPDYMRPARIHFLDEIGRTPSGKADRRGLAEMLASEMLASSERPVKTADPERDPGLRLVLSVLAEVVGHPVDGSEPMSDLVSDSLTAALVAAQIKARSTCAVTPGDILGAAHLSSLAELVSGSGESASTHAEEPATISAGQEGLLVQHCVSNVPERLNIVVSIELAGHLRLDRLAGAIRGIVERHPALRTQFTMGPAGFESAVASTETDIKVIRVQDNAVGIVAAELIAADSAKPFDLTTGVLTRWAVVTGQSRHCLVGMLHHVACDGISLNVVGKELAEFYSNGPATRTVLEPARTVIGGRRETVLAGYWQRRLEGAWDASAALGGRGLSGGGKPATMRRTTIPILFRDIVRIARYAGTSGVTGFSVVLAAMAVALADFWNNNDITIAVPVTARSRAEEHSVGYYLNTVLMRIAVDRSADPKDLVPAVHHVNIEAQRHADLPFAKIVQPFQGVRGSGLAPITPALLVAQPPPGAFAFADLTTTKIDFSAAPGGAIGFALLLNVVIPPDAECSRTAWLDYDSGFISDNDATCFIERFCSVLRNVIESGQNGHLSKIIGDQAVAAGPAALTIDSRLTDRKGFRDNA